MPQKSFNPSANPSLLLILNRKVAEGFGFQTLQTLQLGLKKQGLDLIKQLGELSVLSLDLLA